ncbi:MAG: phosphatidylinositol mannoside acyltransferase [Mycobacteriaceae bacterium]|nr:phosphatidylinositol mannoside acyltransferase [Mycobacteriaceae bacterium]
MISAPTGIWTPRIGRNLLGDHVRDWGYAAGWMLVRAMPETLARKAFDAGAYYSAVSGDHEQLRKNLARVTGVAPNDVPDSLMRASLASYARYWREAFRLPSMDHRELGPRLDEAAQGYEHVAAAFDEGRGAVLALPHSGNWDMAGVWMVYKQGTFTTVAERLKPESLYRRFITYRESLGFEVLPLTGDRPPYQVLLERLRANRMVCLMAERDLTRTGVEVGFFGEPTRMPAGSARLAIDTGAALLTVHCWFEDDGWGVRIQPPLDTSSGDVTAITQAMADRFAQNIADYPADWHMLQPQWLADLSADRRARLQDPDDPGAGAQRLGDDDPGAGAQRLGDTGAG